MSIKIAYTYSSFLTVLLFFIIGIWSMTTYLDEKLTNWAARQPQSQIVDPNTTKEQ